MPVCAERRRNAISGMPVFLFPQAVGQEDAAQLDAPLPAEVDLT